MCMRKQKCVRRTRDGSLLIQREAANALQIPCRMSVGDKVSEVRSSSTLCLSKIRIFARVWLSTWVCRPVSDCGINSVTRRAALSKSDDQWNNKMSWRLKHTWVRLVNKPIRPPIINKLHGYLWTVTMGSCCPVWIIAPCGDPLGRQTPGYSYSRHKAAPQGH